MKEILKIGVPTLVFQLLTSLSIILINNQANALSVTHTKEYVDSVIAGMGAVTRIVSMGSLMVFGFIKGFQPIAGYSYGAKNFKRLNESIKTSILWSTVFCALFGLLLILFPATIISKFTAGDMELVRIGQASLRANGFSIMLFGFYTVYSSLFLALGKGLEGFILGACRQGICFVPIILLLPSLVGISGILYAQPIADLISAIITVFMAINLHKSLEKEIFKRMSEYSFIQEMNSSANVCTKIIFKKPRIIRYGIEVKNIGYWESERVFIPEKNVIITQRKEPMGPFKYLVVIYVLEKDNQGTKFTYIEEFDVCDNYQNEVEKIYSDISKKVNPILQKITDYFNLEHILQ